MRRAAATLAGCLALALSGLAATVAEPPPPPNPAPPSPATAGWQTFEGTWSAAGRRQAIELAGGGTAVVVELSGAVVLTRGSGLSRGFQGRAIGYDDGQGLSVGRCTWTDEHSDRLFTRLRGEPLESGKRIIGTITGGTGRYAGLAGEYSFTWQYVVHGEDDGFQGRSVGLPGRFRRDGSSP